MPKDLRVKPSQVFLIQKIYLLKIIKYYCNSYSKMILKDSNIFQIHTSKMMLLFIEKRGKLEYQIMDLFLLHLLKEIC